MISRSRECQSRHDLEKAADDRFETTVHIVRNLALTACRRGEAINLRREPSRVSDEVIAEIRRRERGQRDRAYEAEAKGR
jgi:hypothetical protein